jgi:hypothetical protein
VLLKKSEKVDDNVKKLWDGGNGWMGLAVSFSVLFHAVYRASSMR